MAREGKPERYLRQGIQPFIEQGETLRYVTLGTNKASFGLEVFFGSMGQGIGGVVGSLMEGVGEAASKGKKDLLVGLTDRRLLLVEVLEWGFDFLLSLGAPTLPGAVKRTGKAHAIALTNIKGLEYKKKGSFESVLLIDLPDGKMPLAFEKLHWVGRATEMVKLLQSERQEG
jgi:hypothetical protein